MAKKTLIFAAISVVAALGLTGCAGGESEAAPIEEASSEVVSLNVGITPTGVSTSQIAALEEGYYEAHGLDVTHKVQTNLAEAMPLLLSGDLDFVYADTHAAIAARAEGMPIQIAVPVVVAPESVAEGEKGTMNFIVKEDSPIQSMSDFEGKVLAVAALGGQAHLDTLTVLEREGLDVDAVEFITILPPQMETAIRQGQADVAGIVEPRGTAALENGGIRMIGTTDDALPGAPMFVLIALQESLEKNPEVLERFEAAMFESAAAVNADRSLADKTMTGFMDMPAELIAKTAVPKFGTERLTADDLTPVIDRLVKMGTLTEDQRSVGIEVLAG